MGKARFTNGEWYTHPNGVGCGGVAIVITPNGCVLPKSEDDANAHLIAAAPEMYKAIQELTDFFFLWDEGDTGSKFENDMRSKMEVALSTLAKARGE